MVIRERVARSISGCRPDVILFHQRTKSGASPDTCNPPAHLRNGTGCLREAKYLNWHANLQRYLHMSTLEKINAILSLEPHLGYKLIGRKLGLSHNTIKYHLKSDTRLSVQRRTRTYRNDAIEQARRSKGGKCCVCGYDRDFSALDFHHPDPSLKDVDCLSLRKVLNNKGAAAFFQEVELCILVCACCHREIHSGSIICEIGEPPR